MKLVLFDFDGTIADSLPLMVETFRELSRGHRHIHPLLDLANTDTPILDHPTVLILRQKGLKAAISSLKLNKLQISLIYLRVISRFAKRIDRLQPVEGMADVLAELGQQYQLGIVTSNRQSSVQRFLRQHQLEHFQIIKSQPNLFGKAATLSQVIKQQGFDLPNVVYVGDEVRDIEAAQQAGIASIGVSWGLNSYDLLAWNDPTAVIERPDQLPQAIIAALD